METVIEEVSLTYTLWQCVLKILNALCNFWWPKTANQHAAALSHF